MIIQRYYKSYQKNFHYHRNCAHLLTRFLESYMLKIVEEKYRKIFVTFLDQKNFKRFKIL